ncbi:MAG TPA: heavy metal-associated domain-containing protein [Solirubrobacteraceae bacterium]|nr:heavy metal-associated domain-containing protein [Solirubrobacteraceae bacterium]
MSYADIREYQVKGMTCQHCVQSVQQEVSGVEGVEVASVNLPEGRLTVAGNGFADEAVRAAIDEAGYEVAP